MVRSRGESDPGATDRAPGRCGPSQARASKARTVTRTLALMAADLVDLCGEALAAVGLTVMGALSGALEVPDPGDVLPRPHTGDDRHGTARALHLVGSDGRRRPRPGGRPVPEVRMADASSQGRRW